MDYVGKVYKTNNCGDLIITKYVNSREVHVKFVDTKYETKTRITHIRNGTVRDRLAPTVSGVGVLGSTKASIARKGTKEYILWRNMIVRCYDDKYHKKYPTYVNCTASDNFKNFSYFKEWCHDQIGFGNKDWHLDKDILIKGNKIYSEDTCCFVPQDINKLFIKNDSKRGELPLGVHLNTESQKYFAQLNLCGKRTYLGGYATPQEGFYRYKEVKEQQIKYVANIWKDLIDPMVYEALMTYQVEIND